MPLVIATEELAVYPSAMQTSVTFDDSSTGFLSSTIYRSETKVTRLLVNIAMAKHKKRKSFSRLLKDAKSYILSALFCRQ